MGAPPSKSEILEDLGESQLLLPVLVNRGLEANDRAKYLLALIQAARSHADHADRPFSVLRDERVAAGVADDHLDDLVALARPLDGDSYLIPGVGAVCEQLRASVADMLTPMRSAGRGYDELAGRLQSLSEEGPRTGDDHISGAYIDRMASAGPAAGDSLHQLIMDAHRALNHLQSEVATETLAGASVYRLGVEDRPLVESFMAGIKSTEQLKLDHPGLGTTATRAGARLLLQNDIGMTQAHVLVVTVEDLVTTLTYTDDHLERLIFFQSLLDLFPVHWSDARRRRGEGALGDHHLLTGTYTAPDRARLQDYLEHLGSRLVFLIDWNRARKRLETFVKKKDAIALLRWAADQNYGHVPFLRMGGERLVSDAVALANRQPTRYGEPLRDVLGRDATLDILRFAIRAAAEGMLSGKSQLLIRDEISVELLKHVHAAHRGLLESAAEHGSLVVEAARSLHDALIRINLPDGNPFLRRASDRASSWEHRADEILEAVRLASRRVDGAGSLVSVVSALDDAMDHLEEALFLFTALPAQATAVVRPSLEPQARIAAAAARELLKALEISCYLDDEPGDDELEDFLVAVDRVAALEHDADGADRRARVALVTDAPDFRSLHVADLISRAIEDATDDLCHSALQLRDHVLRHVMERRS